MKRHQIMRSGERVAMGNQQRLEIFIGALLRMKGGAIE
jgi:hypothetical protein